MENLRGTEVARERAALVDACRTASDPMFLDEVSSRLQRVVPHVGAFWSAMDPVTSLAVSPARVENISADSCVPWWEAEFLVEDVLSFADLAREPRGVATLHGVTDGHPARSHRYGTVNVPNGFDDELRAVLRTGGTPWGMVVLYRACDDPVFSQAEQDFLAEVSEALGAAFRRLAVSVPSTPVDTGVPPGVLLFDGQGRLRSTTASVEHWMGELRDSTPAVSGGGLAIPTEVFTVVNRARAIAAGRCGGVARARIMGRSGRWIVAHASVLTDPRTGAPDQIAVVLEPANAVEVVPIIVEAFGLTAREREVVTCITRGMDTGEIAAHLFLSPHTVRDHCKAIFEKVGVTSRGELVARLFATVDDLGAHAPVA
jgi:DNA-binding CsgD family transcriptional regulator